MTHRSLKLFADFPTKGSAGANQEGGVRHGNYDVIFKVEADTIGIYRAKASGLLKCRPANSVAFPVISLCAFSIVCIPSIITYGTH